MAKPDQPGWASKSSNTLSLIWISPLQKGLPNCQLCPLPSFAMQHRIRTLGQLSLTPVRALHDGSVDFAWTEELKKSHWIEFSAQQDIWECPRKVQQDVQLSQDKKGKPALWSIQCDQWLQFYCHICSLEHTRIKLIAQRASFIWRNRLGKSVSQRKTGRFFYWELRLSRLER